MVTKGNTRDEEIYVSLATARLEDMIDHFPPRRKPWLRNRQTWRMLRRGLEVRSRTDYILETDIRLLLNVSVQDAWHNRDHYMVLGCLCGATPTMN